MAILIPILIFMDRIIKYFISKNLQTVGSIQPCIANVLQFRLLHNTGASFSLFSDSTLLLTILTAVLLCALLLFLVWQRKKLSVSLHIGLGLILAGGIGNLIDRIAFGYVVDYIELLFIRFAVFNFADILVCIGTCVTCLALILAERKKNA